MISNDTEKNIKEFIDNYVLIENNKSFWVKISDLTKKIYEIYPEYTEDESGWCIHFRVSKQMLTKKIIEKSKGVVYSGLKNIRESDETEFKKHRVLYNARLI